MIILEAVYGDLTSERRLDSINVTVPLQVLVDNSALIIHQGMNAALFLSSLMNMLLWVDCFSFPRPRPRTNLPALFCPNLPSPFSQTIFQKVSRNHGSRDSTTPARDRTRNSMCVTNSWTRFMR